MFIFGSRDHFRNSVEEGLRCNFQIFDVPNLDSSLKTNPITGASQNIEVGNSRPIEPPSPKENQRF